MVQDIELLNLKHKLEYQLINFISINDLSNPIFYLFLNELKIKYVSDLNSIEFINRFYTNLRSLNVKVNEFISNICINNVNSKKVLEDLITFINNS